MCRLFRLSHICHLCLHANGEQKNNKFHNLFLDPEKVERVKQLYEDLQLPHTYSIYEEESYKIILTHIQQVSRGLSHDIFFKILDKIYRRNS